MGCASEDRLLGGVLGVDLSGLDNLKALDALCVEGEEGAAAGFALVFDHSAYAHGAVEEVVKQFCPLALVGLAVVFIEFDEELLLGKLFYLFEFGRGGTAVEGLEIVEGLLLE